MDLFLLPRKALAPRAGPQQSFLPSRMSSGVEEAAGELLLPRPRAKSSGLVVSSSSTSSPGPLCVIPVATTRSRSDQRLQTSPSTCGVALGDQTAGSGSKMSATSVVIFNLRTQGSNVLADVGDGCVWEQRRSPAGGAGGRRPAGLLLGTSSPSFRSSPQRGHRQTSSPSHSSASPQAHPQTPAAPRQVQATARRCRGTKACHCHLA